MTKGLFITFEGGDGCGKGTQIDLMKGHLEKLGFDVVLTREPGGTIISEKLRDIILDKTHMEMTDRAEALLYAAARAQHVEEFIVPSIEAGKIVICDRFVDSSVVYQGFARDLGIDAVEDINVFATGGVTPDMTILIDVSAEAGLARKKSQQELDRLESAGDKFHAIVASGYRLLAGRHPDRITFVDGERSIEAVHEDIRDRVMTMISVKNMFAWRKKDE